MVVAGIDPLVERLNSEGVAVLAPTRRGFVAVEPLLRATYDDLAGDVAAAVVYLDERDDIDAASLAVVAQADDAASAMIWAAFCPISRRQASIVASWRGKPSSSSTPLNPARPI